MEVESADGKKKIFEYKLQEYDFYSVYKADFVFNVGDKVQWYAGSKPNPDHPGNVNE